MPSPTQLQDRDCPSGYATTSHDFHPAVHTWFQQRFPAGPTEAQAQGWPAIAAGRNTLIAAPTGSGKTLAGFLIAIDDLYQRHTSGETVIGASQVVYVSPLKALAGDIAENLQRPLDEIARTARELGFDPPPLTVAVRTGDTPAHTRVAMIKKPANFVVTTPESLYLLVTAARSREMLRTVKTVIVDEIHATARDKRGSHLALTLERLEHVTLTRPIRIGLSATQHPITTIADLLTGIGPTDCAIINTGHQRQLDIGLELIDDELEAVTSHAQMDRILDRMAELIGHHRTTIVFVNTRRLSERLAHQLAERLGEDEVAAHHGSLSTERRLLTEHRLRAGQLKALVATASLELGIDIGPVELVCQVGSPRSIATFLQRVGRANHSRHGIPKGRLWPLTRDELIESLALINSVNQNLLDAIHPPEAPLDILVQQLIAEAAADDGHTVDGLYRMFTRAAPYTRLTRAQFDEAVNQAARGVNTGRGPRGAYLHYDSINQEVRGRRGARLAALTSGGAIGENGDYRVLAEPDDTFIGTVNEDWAVESMAGDIFLLGSHSWRIKQVAAGVVRVVDAGDAPPTVPFWLGEAPARTAELSQQVSHLRNHICGLLPGGPDADSLDDAVLARAAQQLARTTNAPGAAAEQAVTYIAAARTSLGVVPTQQDIVFERFFDDTGGQQLVIHCPFGGRINRAFGLALRKRFCRRFDFELQAAANDNAIILSLGPHHSFPLSDVPAFLHPDSVKETLEQAVLDSPMFTARWRWNLNRALVVLRSRGGRRNPPPIQRMEADDIMAAVFPQAAACQENVTGPIQIPDHLLVRQTLHDTLHEALDVAGLQELLADIRSGRVRTHFRDTTEPSPLSHEILNARPYAFLDDAELADRRTNAVALPRGIRTQQGQSLDLGGITPDVVAQVVEEAAPDPRNPDELHDILTSLIVTRPNPEWLDLYTHLESRGRARTLTAAGDDRLWATTELAGDDSLWATTELAGTALCPDSATDIVRGHLATMGPTTPDQLVCRTTLATSTVRQALTTLEQEGTAMRSDQLPDAGPDTWCARRLLLRMSHLSRTRKRASVQPASLQDFMRFLLDWHHVTPDTTVRGRPGLTRIIEQLQGLDLPAGAWESRIIAKRLPDYQPLWLDELCYRGELAWLRLNPPTSPVRANSMAPRKATPITLAFRSDLPWLLAAARNHAPEVPEAGAVQEIAGILADRGASFLPDLVAATHRLPDDIERALWNGVALGLFTADGFAAVRALLNRTGRRSGHHRLGPNPRFRSRRGFRTATDLIAPGRWSLVDRSEQLCPDDPRTRVPVSRSLVDRSEQFCPDDLAEAVARQLLACWGIVFRDLAHHPAAPAVVGWRDVLKALRRFEDRGLVRGGRFVTGISGEQFAIPDAAEQLQAVRRRPRTGRAITVSACDPLNLTGILLDTPRIPAMAGNTITYRDGVPSSDP
ncbi:DEAD/DEAH box helicase [Candidatus Poriferisocius sp.]|uniref:DEAD/DEAH box helicase n=1 Tax=Candidatus Poriferisocius sp. TaxID=3101276 RepID=UPI003B02099C